MSSVQVRPFRRPDREQLTALVNAHAAAVVPGAGVSVSTVLSHLERQPGEAIVDPWVRERVTLVAEQHDRVVAAAHLLRYHDDQRPSPSYRGLGEIRWLLFWPEAPAGNPYWTDASSAAGALAAACVRLLEQWAARTQYADGALPVPGIYGVPAQWPHVEALYQRAGFAHTGDTEAVYLARIEDLARPAAGPSLPGLPVLTVRRSVGTCGTRLSAVAGEQVVGYLETELLDAGERRPRAAGWADLGNLCVSAPLRRLGVATWLLGQAAAWLDLGQVSRLLAYARVASADPGEDDDADFRAFLAAAPFTELTRTRRGWTRS
jgi:GNAT superfamily N-acetyltransferase